MFIVLRTPKFFAPGATCMGFAAAAHCTPKGVLHISSLREL
ncbi:MAG TPA: hypothetical protein VGQ39_19900 [Pyrinomonadaceae bacterium]|nr:hypothetical protein [Pyrinomonadaceae bacterium]